MESALLKLSFEGKCHTVAIFPGIKQEELIVLLKNVFLFDDEVVGIVTQGGVILPISLVCRSPFLVPNSVNELILSRHSSKRINSDEITSDIVMSELVQFIEGLRGRRVLPDLNANLLLELLKENSTLLFAAYSVAISANDSEYLAEICRDISQSLLSVQGRSACEAQDEVLQVCDQLYINDKITENQLLYLRHLVLIREEDVALLYDKFQEHNDVSVFAKDLYNLSCTHPHQQSRKSLKNASPEDEITSDSSSVSGRNQYFEVLTGIVALMVRSHTATNVEASLLLEMIKNENQFIVAAYELFASDNNLDEMQDTLLRCVKLELHKKHKVQLGLSTVASVIRVGENVVDNVWSGRVPENFIQFVFSVVNSKSLTVKQGIALCDLFEADYDLLISAWEVFTVQNNELDFVDTLRRIVRDVGALSVQKNDKNDVSNAKKDLLLHSLEVLVKQSLITIDDAKRIFGDYLEENNLVVDAVELCAKTSDIKNFLQTLCSFSTDSIISEVINFISEDKLFNGDSAAVLIQLFREKNSDVLEICKEYGRNKNKSILVSSLLTIAQKFETELPLLNSTAQKTVIDILNRANAISSSEHVFLMELVNGNEESVGEVFAKYESSKDVYELINSLKALCDKNNDGFETAETKFLYIVQSMNLSHLETSALRLAIAKNDPAIRKAIDIFRDELDEDALKNALRIVAQSTIHAEQSVPVVSDAIKDEDLHSNSLITSQLARERVFPILIAELVKESILSSEIGNAIMKQFAMRNPVISAALDVYDRDNDMGQLVDTLQEFVEVLKVN